MQLGANIRIQDSTVQGVSDTELLFGQSAAFSGEVKNLGINMKAGILSAFNEINKAGGVAGRKLRLISRDDGYEPEQAVNNTRQLIEQDKVFALLGGVGTSTSEAVIPIVAQSPLLYIGPLSGSSFLRKFYPNTAINIRASYLQETKEMVLRLKKDLNIKRIAVLYQNDSDGLEGLRGIQKAADSILGTEIVAKGTYMRNTTAVKTALLHIKKYSPQAVIIIGAYAPAASFIRWAFKIGMKSTVFLSTSLVEVNSLAQRLNGSKANVFVTQVVPHLSNKKMALIESYTKAMAQMKDSRDKVGPISLEGYIVGRLVILALKKAGRSLTHESFYRSLKQTKHKFDIDGFILAFEDLNDSQGSDAIFLTCISNNRVIPVKNLKFSRKK